MVATSDSARYEDHVAFSCTNDLNNKVLFHTHPKIVCTERDVYCEQPSIPDIFCHLLDSCSTGLRSFTLNKDIPYQPHTSVIVCRDCFLLLTDSLQSFEVFETFIEFSPGGNRLDKLKTFIAKVCPEGLFSESVWQFVPLGNLEIG